MNFRDLQATIADLEAFVPTEEEHENVARLYELTDRLQTKDEVLAAVPVLLGIFERHPHVLLGSPGPVVHCIERAGVESYLPKLLRSFSARPTRMTLWMVGRCLRADLSAESLRSILEAVRTLRRSPQGAEFVDDLDEIVDEYGRL